MQFACTRKGVLSSNWSLFHISASSGTTPHLGGSNGADFSVIVALLSLGMTYIMLAKAYTTCVHKQRRVEQQLAIELLCLTSQQAVALGNSNGADFSVIVALLDSLI